MNNGKQLTQEIKELEEYNKMQQQEYQQIQEAKDNFINTLSESLGISKLLNWIETKMINK